MDKIENVTASGLATATKLDRNDARNVLDALLSVGKAEITGRRRGFSVDGDTGRMSVKVGRQAAVYAVDATALIGLFGTVSAIEEQAEHDTMSAQNAEADFALQTERDRVAAKTTADAPSAEAAA